MRWPFTSYGTGPLLAVSGVALGLSAWLISQGPPGAPFAALPLAVWLFVLWFFRDPERSAPGGEEELVAPADGVVTDVVSVDEPGLGRCTRLGIFLSVFDVHVNRVPCSGSVLEVVARPGLCLDARDARACTDNEAATLVLERPDGRRLAVRQITGLIARRIVCPAKPGQRLARGQRYGMIRFGSRTELLVPEGEVQQVLVRPGESVRGGETLVLRTRVRQPALAR